LKRAFQWLAGVVLMGSLSAILAANFQRDSQFNWFKWKLNREVPTEVKLASAAHGKIVRTIEAPGKVEDDLEVKISAQVMGRIVDLPYKEGDRVEKGKMLVQLDKVQYQAEVDSAEAHIHRLEASIKNMEADVCKAERDMERNRQLFTNRAVSQADFLDNQTTVQKCKAQLGMAQSELDEARASLKKSREDLDRTTIMSPLTGIVSQLTAKEGEVVMIGTMNNAGTVIMSISNPARRVVRARIDENNIALVREGQKAVVHLQNNDTLELTGVVERISPKGVKPGGAAAATGTNDNEVTIFETIIALDSPPPQVRLGMNANVDIQVDERQNALSIPSQAVLHRQARELPSELLSQADNLSTKGPGVKDPSRRYHQVVFVESNGQARCRLVKTGISDENRVEILDGLNDGDTVIVGPYRVFEKLKDGKAVKELVEKEEANEGTTQP
jgi:HlyD family secretion protein